MGDENNNKGNNKSNKFILIGLGGILFIFIIITFIQSSSTSLVIVNSVWEINDSSGDIQPIDFGDNATVRVFDLVVESPNSIVLGGFIDNVAFATISVESFFLPAVNLTIKQIISSRGIIIRDSIPGLQLLTNQNLDETEDALSITSAGDFEGNGMTLFKRNRNFEQPFLGQLVNLRGDMELLNTRSDDGNFTGNREIKIGFYNDVFIVPDTLNLSLINKTTVIGMNQSLIFTNEVINFRDDAFVDTTMYFNQTFNNSVPRTSPDLKDNKIALFARDDDNLYIKRSNGQIKRVSVVGSGSSVFSEVTKFNNDSHFYGNIYLNNSIYNSGVGYACIDGMGRLFKSSTPCHLTSDTFRVANITDPDMGSENSS